MRPSLPFPPGGVAPGGVLSGGLGGSESPEEVGSDDKTESFPNRGGSSTGFQNCREKRPKSAQIPSSKFTLFNVQSQRVGAFRPVAQVVEAQGLSSSHWREQRMKKGMPRGLPPWNRCGDLQSASWLGCVPPRSWLETLEFHRQKNRGRDDSNQRDH